MSNVLIIDDDPAVCKALARILQDAGHTAQCVGGPTQALKHLRHDDLDLVLLDLSMPGIGGLDLLQALAEEPRFARVRVAIYSGQDDPDVIAEAQRLGAQDFLVKGLSCDQLLSRIDALLRKPPHAIVHDERPMPPSLSPSA